MELSLSVRIAEEFLSKEKASMPLDELAAIGREHAQRRELSPLQ